MCVQAFADILASNENFSAPMEETYQLLDLNPADTTTLEDYLQVRAYAVVLFDLRLQLLYSHTFLKHICVLITKYQGIDCLLGELPLYNPYHIQMLWCRSTTLPS